MHIKQFLRSGSLGTLFSAFFYFDISFMVWVMLGPLGNYIAEEFQLSSSQKGLMTAMPILTGSLLRLVLGPLADRIGGRKTALIGLSLTFIPMLMGAFASQSYEMILMIGLLLGVAGASFAVALPMASRWYPPEQQGLVLGIAGAGSAVGGLGGFLLPNLLGGLKESTGSYGSGFMVFTVAALACMVLVVLLRAEWQRTWAGEGGRARIVGASEPAVH